MQYPSRQSNKSMNDHIDSEIEKTEKIIKDKVNTLEVSTTTANCSRLHLNSLLFLAYLIDTCILIDEASTDRRKLYGCHSRFEQ